MPVYHSRRRPAIGIRRWGAADARLGTGIFAVVGTAVVLALLALAAPVGASVPLGTDFRISNVGTDGDVARDAQSLAKPGVAYNPTANEYLVTWEGDGLATDNEQEIFGQRVSPSGAELGTDFRISNMGTDLDADRDAARPAVAYNPTANEYLVTWEGDGLTTNDEFEIFGQRVSAAGTELGTDFRISNVGTDGDANRDGAAPAVAYNPTANEYLVSWTGDGLAVDDELEIFGQRVSAAGTEIGTDFRISNVGTDNDVGRVAAGSAVAYNATANEYVVTWAGDGLATDNEYEAFGQRVSAAGAQVGTDDFRISNVGTDGDTTRGAPTLVDFWPAIAYNPTANEYLVTWPADGLATNNEYEIFGQRMSAAGAEVGTDFRISNMGTDGDVAHGGFAPAVAYNATANAYLVTWTGDGQATDDEFEIFGQDVSAAGTEVGTDFRISITGTDGDANRGVHHPAMAYNPTANEYLVTWPGDGLATDEEYEIFGRRVGAPTVDGDGDGVPDATDNCPSVANPSQANNDGDAQGDACDPDDDNDTVADAADGCPTQAGPASNNGCPLPSTPPDGDGDGVPDSSDNCPAVAGPASNNGCPVTEQKPQNEIEIGKAKLNTKNGSAKLPVEVPGAGELELSGKGVKSVDKQVSAAGTLNLPVKPTGKLADKLDEKGKAKVELKITFTPTGGDPNDESTKATLKQK